MYDFMFLVEIKVNYMYPSYQQVIPGTIRIAMFCFQLETCNLLDIIIFISCYQDILNILFVCVNFGIPR